MKIVHGSFASESGFCNGVPLVVQDGILDALEIEIRHSLVGHNVSALEAMKKILEKSDGK